MYIVIEIQRNNEGVTTPLVFTFDTKAEAESKYYYVLSYAAVSNLPRHGAILLNEDRYLKSDIYRHDANIPDEN